jgi:hypothetical protein
LLANVVGAWMQDNIPEQLLSTMEQINGTYDEEKWNTNVENVITSIIDEQIKSFEQIKDSINNKIKSETKE